VLLLLLLPLQVLHHSLLLLCPAGAAACACGVLWLTVKLTLLLLSPGQPAGEDNTVAVTEQQHQMSCTVCLSNVIAQIQEQDLALRAYTVSCLETVASNTITLFTPALAVDLTTTAPSPKCPRQAHICRHDHYKPLCDAQPTHGNITLACTQHSHPPSDTAP
jgi:hypothetical protein